MVYPDPGCRYTMAPTCWCHGVPWFHPEIHPEVHPEIHPEVLRSDLRSDLEVLRSDLEVLRSDLRSDLVISGHFVRIRLGKLGVLTRIDQKRRHYGQRGLRKPRNVTGSLEGWNRFCTKWRFLHFLEFAQSSRYEYSCLRSFLASFRSFLVISGDRGGARVRVSTGWKSTIK